MALGQIDPLTFVVAQRLAANQNVDSSTATRHALVGTMLGEGILGPVIARQLAIRDAASTAAAVVIAPPTRPDVQAVPTGGSQDAEAIKKWVEGFEKWVRGQDAKDNADIKAAKQRTEERQAALRRLYSDQSQSNSGSTKAKQPPQSAPPAPAPAQAPGTPK